MRLRSWRITARVLLLAWLLPAAGVRADGGPVVEPPPQTGAYSATFVEDRDNVSVIEFSGDYNKELPGGATNSEARAVVAKEFYRTHPDNYDFLVVFSTFEFDTGDATAFHMGIKNTVQGIGLPQFDNTEAFGSEGKLQGYIDMAALSRYETNPLYPEFESVLGTLTHEVLHQWGSFVKFRNPDGTLNEALLGKDGSHWSYLLDSGASVQYGAKWRDNGDGTFTSTAIRKFYSPLDLYLMGFYSADEVPPITLIDNATIDKTQLPRENVTINGVEKTVTIDEIIAAEGPRIPAADNAQKNFRLGFVLLKGPGEQTDEADFVALNSIRNAFMTRFAILTGGRGIAQVYPEALPTETTGTPDTISGGELRDTSANIDEGLAWLRGQQAGEGYWNDKPATRTRDTIVTLQTLLNLDPTFANSTLAIEWLNDVQSGNTDYLARQITLLGNNPKQNTLNRLLALQNSDGGWGLAAGYDSDPQDTALALLALAKTGGQTATVDRAVQYLIDSQNSDGGWSNARGGSSKTGVTSLVLRALHAANRHTDVLDSALTLLASRQNGDGGFGDSPSTVYDTARVLNVFMLFDQMGRILPDEAAGYLYSQQDINGSWNGSTYSTALALSTLKRFSFPNWLVAGMSVEPAEPRDGARVRLDVTITNDTNTFAPEGVLRIFDGEPGSGGTLIGADIVIPPMAPNSSLTFSPYWDSFDKPGTHTFVAVADPDNVQTEMSEQDNRGQVTVNVQSAPQGPELSVIEPDIAVLPANPNLLPTTMGIAADVRNFGLADATNVRVVLIKNASSSEQTIVDETTLNIPNRSSMVVNFTDVLDSPGVTEYTVEIDPDNVITETIKTNNAATVSVETEASIDLQVTPEDITLDQNPALVGEDVIFKVNVHNRGTQDTPTTRVNYVVTNGIETRELGDINLQLAAGESTEQTVTWRVDLTGDLTFTATLDPDALVAELDESNNQASFNFPAQALNGPNLIVSHKDMAFDPNPGHEGYPLTLSALVRNNGNQDASDIEVAFYNGDPVNGGTQIGAIQTIPSLAVNAETNISLVWDPVQTAGDKLIYVVVDPNDNILEFSNEDNAAFEVLSILSLPDFAISANDIQLEPPFPSSTDTVAINARIANLGQQSASNVLVRAYDGDPAQGGMLIGEQTIASFSGNSATVVSFSLDLQGSTSTRSLVVQVDPDSAIVERFRNNNTATREVAVQDGDIYATNLYFSPNGDNIKDTTELFFRLGSAGNIEVRVVNQRDEVVRTFNNDALQNISQGSVVWEGLDDLGRLVADGEYRLRVVDEADSIQGEVTVNLDTNRSSLLKAMGTEYELYTNMTCEIPTHQDLHLADDDNTVTFRLRSGSSPDDPFPKGIYRMAANGSDIRAIISESWFDAIPVKLQGLNLQENEGYPYRMFSSRDGKHVVFMRIDRGPNPSNPAYTTTFFNWFIADSDGSNIRHIPDISEYGTTVWQVKVSHNGKFIYWADNTSVYRLNTDTFFKDTYTQDAFYYINEDSLEVSPDGKYVAIYDNGYNLSGRALLLIQTASGEINVIEDIQVDDSLINWAPDSKKFVIEYTSYPNAGLQVYNAKGELTHLFTPPDALVLDGFSKPSWSSTSNEFAVRINGRTSGGGEGFVEISGTNEEHPGGVFVANLSTGELVEVARLQMERGGLESYHISTWDGSGWAERAVLHYGMHYREQQADLSQYLPDANGEYRVRIRQEGMEAAHVESVALLQDGNRLIPDKAIRLSDSTLDKLLGLVSSGPRGTDVTDYIKYNDNEVLDLHEAEMEVSWDKVSDGKKFILALNAREEALSKLTTLPFTYEKSEGKGYKHTLSGQSSINIDGQLKPEEDKLDLLFKQYTRPDTGHPPATVFGYVGSDDQYLYGALDFTVDNTMDDDLDWASMRVRTPIGWKEYRVTLNDKTHGDVGFVKTHNVPYTHKYYEFRIPLKDIGKQQGDEVEITFQGYGTAAIVVGEEEGLPRWADVIWAPGDRSLLYDAEYEGKWAIFLDDDNRLQPIFDEWPSGSGDVRDPYFSYSGRKILFESNRATYDPNSICYQKGRDTWSFESLLNLVVDLRATRSDRIGGVVLSGTASDLNFESYQLEYAHVGNPDNWEPVAPASGSQVIDDRFTTWVPPETGNYFVRLTAYDTAGNSRSVIRRVSWGLKSSISNLYRTPEFISPNGDGVQDTLKLHYRVLEPVHLEFNVFNANGDRIRTLIRDHSLVGSEHDLIWDGRNEQSMVVPDGDYRITVQNFEFFVTVDNTPPAVQFKLRHALQIVTDDTGKPYYTADPGLEWEIEESNEYEISLDYADAQDASIWTHFQATVSDDQNSETPEIDEGGKALSMQQYTGRIYRIQVRDRAGNRTIIQSEPAKQQVIIPRFYERILSLTADTASVEIGASPTEEIYRNEVYKPYLNYRVVFEELNEAYYSHTNSIVGNVSQIFIQYIKNEQGNWIENEINAFGDIEWLPAGADYDDKYDIRLRMVDNNGDSFYSNIIRVQMPTEVLSASFSIPIDDENDLLYGRDKHLVEGIFWKGDEPNSYNVGSSYRIKTGSNPNVLYYLNDVKTSLQSTDDPRYETPIVIYSRDFENEQLDKGDNIFVFPVNNLVACNYYTASFEADIKVIDKTDPANIRIGSRKVSSIDGFQFPCVSTLLSVDYLAAEQCGSDPPSSAVINLKPTSHDGSPLRLLTLSRTVDDGSEDVLFNVNQPESGKGYQYQVDTSLYDEGVYEYNVTLINESDVEFTDTIEVIVDHTPQSAEITYPQENQRLCGIPRLSSNHRVENYLPVEILVEDPPVPTEGSPPEDILDVSLTYSRGLSSLVNELGFDDENLRINTWDRIDGPAAELIEPNGEYTVYLETIDAGGFKQCTQRNFYVDGRVELAALRSDYSLFSPNGDGMLDSISITYTVDESVTLNVDVYQAVRNSKGHYVTTGEPVRNLVVDRQALSGTGDVTWDGTNNTGSTISDGHYLLKFQYEDACGNLAEQGYHVVLDNTPPAVSIDYPASADTLNLIVEVLGSVSDTYLKDYILEVQSENNTTDWLTLAAGSRVIQSEVLDAWNTAGLSGVYNLRLSANDEAGNYNETLVTVNVPERTNIVSYLESVPRLFSPNGDNKRETTAIRLGIEADASLTVLIKDSSDTVVRSLLQDQQQTVGTLNLAWDGRNDAGVLLPDDTYTVSLAAVLTADSAVTQQEEVTVVLDKTPPAVDITRPTAGFASGEGGILGTIEDLYLRDYTLSLTDTPEQPDWNILAEGNNNQSDAVLTELGNLAEGQYALKVVANDEGEITSETVIPFEVDNTPPQVEILAPLDNSFIGVANAPVGIDVNVTDVNIKAFTLNIGAGDAPETWTELITSETFPINNPATILDVASYADGLYSLQLVAEDKAGNNAETTIQINIDNTPPQADILEPLTNSFIKQPTAVMGTASDANLIDYQLQIAAGELDSASTWNNLGGGRTDVTDAQLLDWQALPPDGPHVLRLLVTDAAANQSEYKVPVIVDTHPPAAPTGLTVTIEAQQDVRLTWNANSEPDLIGYHVYRDGAQLTSTPVPDSEFLDTGVNEGLYSYTVKAIDHAEWLSESSEPVEAQIDLTPPDTRIHLPTNDSVVSGLIDIKGTAYSQDDFKEYRLYAGAGAEPNAWQLLRRSPVPILADVLSDWNTVVLPEGAVYSLKLEAEDIRGNVGVDHVTVTIDNLPPDAPTGLVAVPNGSDVNLTWNANTEPDLLGYLVFRNERVANVDGIVVGDLRPYAVVTTSYPDLSLPDGPYSYTIMAIDQAGNISDPSLPSEVLIDTRPPHVVIVQPDDGSRFETLQYVTATSEDTDIARVQFQYRAAADTAWIDLGAADAEAPYAVEFDPVGLGLSYGDYQLQAVATDLGNKVDPAPMPITVTYIDVTRPSAVIGLATQVNGGDVNLSWQANSEADIAGYHIDRIDENDNTVRITDTLVTETTYSDPALDDQAYRYQVVAIDTSDNVSDPSSEVEAIVYTPVLVQPYTPVQDTGPINLQGQGITQSTLSGTLTTSAGTSALAGVDTDSAGYFVVNDLPLVAGDNTFTIRLTDQSGNSSKDATVNVVSGTAPGQPTGLQASATGYDVDLTWDANPETNIAGYRAFRNDEAVIPDLPVSGLTASASQYDYLADNLVDNNIYSYWRLLTSSDMATRKPWVSVAMQQPELVSQLEVEWRYLDYRVLDYDVQAWTGTGWVTVQQVRDTQDQINVINLDTAYFTEQIRLVFLRPNQTEDRYYQPVRLSEVRVKALGLSATPSYTDGAPDGNHSYTVTAVNELGFESIPSDPAELPVGDVTAPDPVTLSATVTGSDVLLEWTASSATDVLRYDLYRDGELLAEHADLANLNYTDASLQNGTYEYVVYAIDGAGNVSDPSNAAQATISMVLLPPPLDLTVSVVPEGGALDLLWQPAGGSSPAAYRVLRSQTAGGPYSVVTEQSETSLRDTGLTNEVTYFYVIQALDSLGNASNHSNEANGTPQDSVAPAVSLYYPATPDSAYTSEDEHTPIVGRSEPGAIIELYQNDNAPFSAVANPDTVVSEYDANNFEYVSSLSPDGRYAVLTDYDRRLHLVDMNTGQSEVILNLEYWGSAYPDWFNDSRSFIFMDRDNATYNYYVRRYDIETGEITELSNPADGHVRNAVLSPDNTQLAATSYRDSNWTIGVYNLETQQWTSLVDYDSLDNRTLVWSPDSQYVAYNQYNYDTGSRNIEFVGVNTGNVVIADKQADSSNKPNWSPDSNSLIYISQASGNQDVWRYDLDTATASAITNDSNSYTDPRWTADSQSIVYIRNHRDILRRHLSDGSVESLFDNGEWLSHTTLQRVASGYLAVMDTNRRQYLRLDPAGRVLFRSVNLAVGDNLFTATATDAADNTGEHSEATTIVYDLSNRADLVVTEADISILPVAPIRNESARITVAVHNQGSVASTQTVLTLYAVGPAGSQTLIDQGRLPAIPAGESISLAADWLPQEAGSYTIVAVVDPTNLVLEVSELNNVALVERSVAGSANPQLTVTTDKSEYTTNENMSAEINLENSGDTFNGRMEVRIEDTEGYPVTAIYSEPVSELSYSELRTISASWNTGQVFAGTYQVHAYLYASDNSLVAEASSGFTIGEVAGVRSSVSSDQPSYHANADVRITGKISFNDGNTFLTGADAILRIVDSNSTVMAETRQSLGSLSPGSNSSVTLDWNTGLSAPGDYFIELNVIQDETLISQAQGQLVIETNPTELEGALQLSASAPAVGDPQTVTYSLTNTGNATLNQLPVRVSLVDTGLQSLIDRRHTSLDILPGANAGSTFIFDTAGLSLKTYTVVLEADISSATSGEWIILSTTGFPLQDRQAPVIEIRQPLSNSYIRGDALAVLLARDDLSVVSSVEVNLNGSTAWSTALVNDPARSLYQLPLPGLTEGPHTIQARATDSWNNQGISQIHHFVVDNTPPVIDVSGITNDGMYNQPVTPVVTVTELYPDVTHISQNGSPFASGADVSAEGQYTFNVLASDLAGNRTVEELSYTIDITPPVVTIEGVENGIYYNAPVSPVITVTDNYLEITEITLNGQPFKSGTEIPDDGNYTLDVLGRDQAGNETLETIEFVVDTTAPVISISGVAHLALYNTELTPTVSIDDINLDSANLVLNGLDFESGIVVSEEGEYRLLINAMDLAGNSSTEVIDFEIDLTAPVTEITGVENSGVYNSDVIPEINVTDKNLNNYELTLNDQPYSEGSPITVEGVHLLSVLATDKAGNQHNTSVGFEIDLTPPVVVIDTPVEGETFSQSNIDIAGHTEPYSTVYLMNAQTQQTTQANLAGNFTFSQVVLEQGDNTLIFHAVDRAGNVGPETQLNVFVVQGELIGKILPASGTLIWAPEQGQACGKRENKKNGMANKGHGSGDDRKHHNKDCHEHEPNEIEGHVDEKLLPLIASAIEQGDQYLLVHNKYQFIRALRSQRYGKVLLFELHPGEEHCHNSHNKSNDRWKCEGYEDTDYSNLMIDNETRNEIRAMVASGTGLVWIKTHPDNNEHMQDLFGVEIKGVLPKTTGLSISDNLLPTTQHLDYSGKALRVNDTEATRMGELHPSGKPAMTQHQYGEGQAILINFNPINVTQLLTSQDIISAVLARSQKNKVELFTNSVVQVEWTAKNIPVGTSVRFAETLDPGMRFILAPDGDINNDTDTAIWQSLYIGDPLEFTAMIGLPTDTGIYNISGRLERIDNSFTDILAEEILKLDVANDENIYSSSIMENLSLIPWKNKDERKVDAALYKIHEAISRDIRSKESAAQSIEDLVQAIDILSALSTDTTAIQSEIGKLTRIYQAYWSTY